CPVCCCYDQLQGWTDTAVRLLKLCRTASFFATRAAFRPGHPTVRRACLLCHHLNVETRGSQTSLDMTSSTFALVLTTLLAATVNGSLGYGFSSITAPVALLFYTNRILNPALVWVEVVLNAYVLWVNRASVPQV